MLNPTPDDAPVIVEFDTVDQLKSVEFIQQFMQQPNFKQLSLFRNALMVEFTDGTSETIGFISNTANPLLSLVGFDLPQWKAPLLPPPV